MGDTPAVTSKEAALAVVVEAAERYARELLNQASKYERLGFQSTADSTLREHYRPLRDAIDCVTAEGG